VGNEEPFLGSMARRSATIDPNPQEMAAWAMDQLLARIDQPSKDPVRVMVQPYLVAPTAAEQR
jgi:DNA-binding LacI/PurR family transcriptional regulator